VHFRIRWGTHVPHFHPKCPRWPSEKYYEQEKPLWWGTLCEECCGLADIDVSRVKKNGTAG